jgi:hypothetical protein
MSFDNQFFKALQEQMPEIKSQAQLDAFLTSLGALKSTVSAILSGDKEAEARGREALSKSLEAVAKATQITEKLREVPEAATSKEAEAFKSPPKEFSEGEVYQGLMSELEDIRRPDLLSTWYQSNRQRIDQVVSQGLRDTLFDAIREKKHLFSQEIQ